MTRGLLVSSLWSAAPARWDGARATLEAIAGSIEILPSAVAQVRADVRRQIASYPKPAPSYVRSASSSSSPSTATAAASSSAGGDGIADYWDTQDKLHTAWSDGMREQDRTVSPSTGEEYIVPNNAWNASGPQGAGYYRALPGGGEERLQVENVVSGTTE